MVEQHHNAAQYLRMSTDLQDLSIAVQEQAIGCYAADHGLSVVATYRDEGRSGLSLRHRAGMQQLLCDVILDRCPFQVVLVYDVSRWGRFQDTDASAYYEYHCRLHGVEVVYVKEPFSPDTSAVSTLIKSLKRVMAAEYSRELGVKVRAGQDRAISLGFQMGTVPLGFVRTSVSKDGSRTRTLLPYERKAIQSDRIRWQHGPRAELDLVRRIFSLYTETHLSIKGVARQLTSEGSRYPDGRVVDPNTIRKVLRCEAYIGNFVWGRYKYPGGAVREEDDAKFLRSVGVVDPLISRDVWDRAQSKLASCTKHPRNRTLLLQDLKSALQRNPRPNMLELSSYGCQGPAAYVREFGSMEEAVRLAGGDFAAMRRRRAPQHQRTCRLATAILRDVHALLLQKGMPVGANWRSRMLRVGAAVVKIELLWQLHTRTGPAWFFDHKRDPADHVLFARMLADDTAFDFVLVTREEYRRFPRWSREVLLGQPTIRTEGALALALLQLGKRPWPAVNDSLR